MKLIYKLLLTSILILSVSTISAKERKPHKERIILETSFGDIEIKLYKDTPLHAANFIKLVKEGYYDGLLFHRVIENFMIQAGDPNSRNAESGIVLGDGSPDYTIEAEIKVPEHYHRKGVLAAAREGDNGNPERRSSGSQFYIVCGEVFDDSKLEKRQERVSGKTSGEVKFSKQMIESYKTIGGTPFLDGQYTVFGEVVKGMEIVDEIQKVEVDKYSRPTMDVHIIRAYIK